MKAVNNTDLNSSLDQDLVDFVMAGARRWHGDRIVVLIAFIVYGFNNFAIVQPQRHQDTKIII